MDLTNKRPEKVAQCKLVGVKWCGIEKEWPIIPMAIYIKKVIKN